MNTEKFKVIETSDGSSSVFDSQFGENFHSTYGAIAESMHVYISNGLKLVNTDEISILEIGFGTGLNCLLTIINKDVNQKITYHTIEKYPLEIINIQKLNYSQQLNMSSELFDSISNLKWNFKTEIVNNFFLKKLNVDLLDFNSTDLYDIIYFDAYSPNTQPELWTTTIFEKMFNNLKQGGILTTYSSKGDVKRALRSAGFQVFRIKGPNGKRHILRALKI